MIFARTLQLYRNSYGGLSKDIWLLSLVMLINRAGTMVVPFLSLYLTASLDFSLSQVGWVMSAFGLGSVAGSFIGGKLTDRIGYFQVQFWALFLSGFLFISLIWVSSFWMVCLMIFITTTVADAFRPANFTAVAAYSNPENRTRAIALVRMAINLGFAIGPAIGGLLAVTWGYHYLFIIDGISCIGAAILLRLMLSEREASREEEKEAVTTEMPTSAATASPYRDKRYMFFIVLVILNAIVFFQLISTEPIFFRNAYGLDESQIGLLMAFNGLFIAATEMPLIYVLEKRFSKLAIVNFGTFLIGFSFWIFTWMPPGLGTAFFSVLCITVGEMLSLPFISSLAMDRTTEQNRGQYMAVFTMAYSLSHIVSPNLGMQLTDGFGFTFMWNVVTAISIVACVGFYFFGKGSELKIKNG